jgi:hypothetical protein
MTIAVTRFDPALVPALNADPAHRCASTLSTAMFMAGLGTPDKDIAEFRADVQLCSAADATRARDLMQRLGHLMNDIHQFKDECFARVEQAQAG